MLLRKEGYPETDTLVLCTVGEIGQHGVFCSLDEYGSRSALIHISEIAPGRIRNIREYVKEGKKVVCRVLATNPEKGHIDLSLRRVNETQRRGKLNEVKQEQLAESIVEHVARQRKEEPRKVYEVLAGKLLPAYGRLYPVFEEVALAGGSFEQHGIPKELAGQLTEAVQQRIKPPHVEVKGELRLTSHAPNGVEIVRAALQKAESVPGKPVIRYRGGGTYRVVVASDDYRKAERTLKEAVDACLQYAKSQKAAAEFVRIEEK
jgi:translation initiation factor 2 subunit 1